jgi:hypothetical protein
MGLRTVDVRLYMERKLKKTDRSLICVKCQFVEIINTILHKLVWNLKSRRDIQTYQLKDFNSWIYKTEFDDFAQKLIEAKCD